MSRGQRTIWPKSCANGWREPLKLHHEVYTLASPDFEQALEGPTPDLWNQAPTPAKAARLRQTTIERFIKAHRLRRWQAPEVLRILKQKPLSVAPGVVEAASDHIRTLTVRIRLVNQQLKAAHRKLDELCAQLIPSEENEPGQQCEQRDVVILRSMPGLGRIILAVLLAEVWQPLRRRDYHALRSLSGVAPVTRRSGKTSVVVRRYACNKRLANALYHWARMATQRDALSRPLGTRLVRTENVSPRLSNCSTSRRSSS